MSEEKLKKYQEILSNPKKQIKTIKELNITIVAVPHDYYVEFLVYNIDYWEERLEGDVPFWHRAEAPCTPDGVPSLEAAEAYLSGSVKWDGCSNWHFDEQDRCMLHGCSREHLVRFGEMMAFCWDWAAELCPNWDDVVEIEPVTDENLEKVETGVMIMKDGLAWGQTYADGKSTEYGWMKPVDAPIRDPKYCKNPTDATYAGSHYVQELQTGTLVPVVRKTQVIVRKG
jgi:hypothetical protein